MKLAGHLTRGSAGASTDDSNRKPLRSSNPELAAHLTRKPPQAVVNRP